MKVLVATSEGQGKRKNDFNNAREDELVGFAFECDGEAVDGSCGCRRAFSGLDTLMATTTARVLDIAMTPEEYLDALVASSAAAGWNFSREELAPEAVQLASIASTWAVGTVVEKRGARIGPRRLR